MSENPEPQILVIRPLTGGARRYAVTSLSPEFKEIWWQGCRAGTYWHQSDQTWELKGYRRVEDRGFIAVREGAGQWSNRGIHGTDYGTGATMEKALYSAWAGIHRYDVSEYFELPEIPLDLLAACRDYDEVINPSPVK